MGAHRDDLTAIVGIGPKTAEKLNAEGVITFRDIAEWNEDDIDRLDMKIGLKGKPRSEDWRGQAIKLLGDGVGAASEDTGETVPSTSEPVPDASGEALAKALATIEALEARLAAKATVPVPEAPAAPETASDGKRRRRLNRNRKFSEVYGSHNGAAFMQVIDGAAVYFNPQGVEMFEGEEARDAVGPAEPEHVAKTYEDVHFLNLLDKKADYPDALIRQAVKLRLGKDVRTRKEALEFLHTTLRQS